MSVRSWQLLFTPLLMPTGSCATCCREPALAGGWTSWSPEASSNPCDATILRKTCVRGQNFTQMLAVGLEMQFYTKPNAAHPFCREACWKQAALWWEPARQDHSPQKTEPSHFAFPTSPQYTAHQQAAPSRAQSQHKSPLQTNQHRFIFLLSQTEVSVVQRKQPTLKPSCLW